MKTTKLNLFIFTLTYFFFTFAISFAQEETAKQIIEEKSKAEKSNSTQALNDKVEFKNETTNSILTITDEGNDAGSIELKDINGVTINTKKLLNEDGNLTWGGSQLGTSASAAGWIHSGTNTYTSGLVDRVGIGTSSPNKALDVIGSAQFRDNNGNFVIDVNSNSTSLWYAPTNTFPFINIKLSLGETIFEGKVGIGTSNPSSKLSVGGVGTASSTIYGENTTGTGIHGLATTGSAVFGSSDGKAIHGYSASGHAGYFQGRGYFSEDVGIGEPSPSYQLHVKDDAPSNFVTRIENTSIGTDADGLAILLNVGVPASSNHYIRFQKSGGAGIGSISGNGNSVNYNTTSDARLKTNIENYNNALETVSSIGIKKYERISNPGIEEIGVLAQELQKVYPQAVSGKPDSDVNTDPMMVDYSKLSPLLVKGMQEQQERIKDLEKQNAEIRIQNLEVSSKNQELEERLTKLESLLDGKRFTSK